MVVNGWRNVLVLLALLVPVNVSLAQRTTATFAGIVQDPTGAVLPGADAVLINEGTSGRMQHVTNETGEFLFDFVPVGTYTLRLGLPGFKTYESRGIPLGAAQNVRRTYTLEVGAVSDNVTVTGEAPLVNTLSPEQRLSLDTLQVANLPMINRNISAVIEYSGTGLTKAEPNNNVGSGGVRFRLNGLGAAAMAATANGSDASGYGSTTIIGGYGGFTKIDLMSAEAVGEVQIVKGVIPAEYSGLSGNLNVITKSGTNQWHGSLFHRYEGSVLSARQPILSAKPHSVWNQYGGSLGGRIVRDKVFFFVAYEGYRQRGAATLTNDVPTPRFRDILRQSLPFPETETVLKYYTLPNQPYTTDALLGRWIGPGVSEFNDDHFDTKVDYLIGSGNLSVTFTGGHPSQLQAAQMPLNPRTFASEPLRANTAYVIGRGRWTSSTRFGYNLAYAQRIEQFWNEKDPKKAETIEGGRGVPGIMYPGMTSLLRENRNWGLLPSWSMEQQFALFRGAHSLKFGGKLDLRRGGTTDSTNSGVTYQTLDDVQRNIAASVTHSLHVGPNVWSMNNFGFYVQDDWRAARKLVLNLGLRYDRYGAFIAEGRYDDQPARVYNLDGLLDPVNFIWGPLRDPLQPIENDNLNFGPRIGFAYTADSRGDFVVRGGFGMNFAGFDGAFFEGAVERRPDLPGGLTFSRVESATYGLKYPAYNEDMVQIILDQKRVAQPASRFNPNLSSPYAMNYTLGIQRALTPTLIVETAFVGTRGVKFNLSRSYNPVNRVTGVRPNPNDIQGSYVDNSQQTNYNSWQTSVKQRLSHGLAVNFNHTWGKTLSYTGGDSAPGYIGDSRGGIEDFDNIRVERSRSAGDVAHTVSMDWVYQAPTPFATSAVARQVLGGWNISGIWKARTGLPLGVTQTGGRSDIIDIDGAVNKNCCSFGNLQYLNPAAFALVTVPTASGRTIRRGHQNSSPLSGPGIWNVDLSMAKNFSVTESSKLELKTDMLNALNHTQYTGIATNMSGLAFGQATTTASARVIQIQLRLTF